MPKPDDEQLSQSRVSPTSQRRAFLQALACLTASEVPVAASAETAGDSPGVGTALRTLLGRNHELKPDYGGGFSNHVSMGLYSLAALGGTGESLARFAEAHWSALEPLPKAAGPQVAAEQWRAWLGQPEALNGYRTLFAAEVERLGRAEVLRASVTIEKSSMASLTGRRRIFRSVLSARPVARETWRSCWRRCGKAAGVAAFCRGV